MASIRFGRTALGWGAALTAVAVGLCYVPLLNLLGYESSLVLGLLGSLAAVQVGAAAVSAARARQSPADADRDDARPGRAVLALYGRAAGAALAGLGPPLLVLLANGLRVRNCDYLAGLSFYFMIPVCSAACGAGLGVGAGLALRRRWPATLLGWALLLGSLLWAGLRFLRSPAISAYDPIFGYFPGALYDEEVAVLRPFYAARALHGLWLAGGLALCAGLLDGHGLRLRLRWRPLRGRAWAAALVSLALAAAGQASLGRLAIHHDSDAVERALSLERRTEHFVLRYGPGGPVARDIDLYAKEHELRYRQLRDLLGVEPTWRTGWVGRLLGIDHDHDHGHRHDPPLVVSYLFDSARQKHALMGASSTYIAKPWRREIYLQHDSWPHDVLKHELAHVFLGAAGDPLLRVSLRGLLPHQGMIEGLAVAADWRGGHLSPHQSVKAMREAHLEPPLEQVFGLAFLTVSAGRAYTVAGSFCRYLLERFGPGPLLAVYRAGGRPEAFTRAFGVPFPRLAADWRAFIDRQEVPRDEREVERERVRRPAVFYKVCAHELALRRQEAREAVGRGDLVRARRLLESICREDPAEPRHLSELMDFLWGAGLHGEAEAAARRLLTHPGRTPVLEARARSLLGDAAWLRGDGPGAGQAWAEAARLPTDEGQRRLLIAKQWALARPALSGPVLDVLVGPRAPPGQRAERDGALDMLALERAVAAHPQEGMLRYLLGRQLVNRGGFREAAAELRRARELGLPDRRFTQQAGRLLGQALLRAGDTAGARAVLTELLGELRPVEEGQRIELRDWLERAAVWPAL